jgi:hypothetical protein
MTGNDASKVEMENWEAIADNFSKRRWTWGYVSALDFRERTIWVPDAHRGDGKRHVVRADEEPSAFLEFEAETHGRGESRKQPALTA